MQKKSVKSKIMFTLVSGLLITTRCSNSSGIVINQDKTQAKALKNYTDKYVALVEPLQFREKALKMQQLLQPDASFYDFYIE